MTTATRKTVFVRVGADGRLTIPDEFATALGITAGMLLRVNLEDGELRITPDQGDDPDQRSSWLRELYDYFAPVREEILARGISEEEVNDAIDAAIAEVRAERRTKRE
jgi:bifunctional DNA-binding transcriptional regulator/antitoxin component of YhaV-PrlF toxin-antitoxin module